MNREYDPGTQLERELIVNMQAQAKAEEAKDARIRELEEAVRVLGEEVHWKTEAMNALQWRYIRLIPDRIIGPLSEATRKRQANPVAARAVRETT